MVAKKIVQNLGKPKAFSSDQAVSSGKRKANICKRGKSIRQKLKYARTRHSWIKTHTTKDYCTHELHSWSHAKLQNQRHRHADLPSSEIAATRQPV